MLLIIDKNCDRIFSVGMQEESRMKLATYRSGGAIGVGAVEAETGRLFDLSAAARRAGAPEAPFASMLALIDSDESGLDLARSLVGRRGGEADLWSDLNRV